MLPYLPSYFYVYTTRTEKVAIPEVSLVHCCEGPERSILLKHRDVLPHAVVPTPKQSLSFAEMVCLLQKQRATRLTLMDLGSALVDNLPSVRLAAAIEPYLVRRKRVLLWCWPRQPLDPQPQPPRIYGIRIQRWMPKNDGLDMLLYSVSSRLSVAFIPSIGTAPVTLPGLLLLPNRCSLELSDRHAANLGPP